MQKNAKPAQVNIAAESDENLVTLARDSDEAAVRTLVRRHNQRLFRAARSVVRDDSEAEDVVQETYVKAFTQLSLFRGESQFSTWLTRICINEALSRLRRRRPTAEIEEIDRQAGGASIIPFPTLTRPDSPEANVSRNEVGRLIERAIDQLPKAYRMVFVLRVVQDMSIEETSKLLSLPAATVKTRLHRARKLLVTALDRKLAPSFAEAFPFDGARCANMADRVVARLKAVRGD